MNERTYLSRDERRNQLLEVGLALFSARTYAGVSIDDLAGEAGVSKGLLYHYFGSKQGLYVEVVRLAAAQLLEAIAPDPGKDDVANLRHGVAAYFEFCRRHRAEYLALMTGGAGGADADVASIIEGTRQAITSQILTHMGIDTPSSAFRIAARSWLGSVEAAALEWLKDPVLTVDQLVDMVSAGMFGEVVVAARIEPLAGVRIDLVAGIELLTGLGRR